MGGTRGREGIGTGAEEGELPEQKVWGWAGLFPSDCRLSLNKVVIVQGPGLCPPVGRVFGGQDDAGPVE